MAHPRRNTSSLALDQCEGISMVTNRGERCSAPATRSLAQRRVCHVHVLGVVFFDEDGIGDEQRARARRVAAGD